jgi:hypothetical protein
MSGKKYIKRAEEAYLYTLMSELVIVCDGGFCEYTGDHSDSTMLARLREKFPNTDALLHHVANYRLELFGKRASRRPAPKIKHELELQELRGQVESLM